jgi:hypothetical protein
MPFDGNGTFSPSTPEFPAISGTVILADDWNAIVTDLAAGLTNALCRDGQSSMLANLNMGTFKITNMGAGLAAGQALRFEQIFGVPGVLLDGLLAVTQAPGDTTQKLATTEFVNNAAFGGALPAQLGNAGKFIKTDGVNASWQFAKPTVEKFDLTLSTTMNLATTLHGLWGVFLDGRYRDEDDFLIVGDSVQYLGSMFGVKWAHVFYF